MRDVNAFRERFNYWKSTGELPYEAGLPKYAPGKDDETIKLSKKQHNVVRRMYNILKNDGYDDNSIAGILGNAMQESSFDPDSISKKDYHGLLQNSRQIHNSVVATYGDHSFDSQMKYLLDWGNNNARVRTKKHGPWLGTSAGKYKKGGYKTAEDAATAFMKTYERPVILDKNGKIIGYQEEGGRRKYAKQMYRYILSNFSKNPVGPQTPERVVESVPTAVEMIETAPKWESVGTSAFSYNPQTARDNYTAEYLNTLNSFNNNSVAFVPSSSAMLKNAINALNDGQLYKPEQPQFLTTA